MLNPLSLFNIYQKMFGKNTTIFSWCFEGLTICSARELLGKKLQTKFKLQMIIELAVKFLQTIIELVVVQLHLLYRMCYHVLIL